MSLNFKPIRPVPYPSDRPYKVYTFLFTQEGAFDPEVIVHENTIGNIVWTRNGPGLYTGTLTGAFPENKTYIYSLNSTLVADLMNIENIPYVGFSRSTNNSVEITLSGSLDVDGKFSNAPFEIRVYP